MAIVNGWLHNGHGMCLSLRRSEQASHTQWCPHGTMMCVICSLMHTTHMSGSTPPTAVAAVCAAASEASSDARRNADRDSSSSKASIAPACGMASSIAIRSASALSARREWSAQRGCVRTKRRREARPTTRPTSSGRATRTTAKPVNARGETTPSETQSATREASGDPAKDEGDPKPCHGPTRTTTVPTPARACDENRALWRIRPYAGRVVSDRQRQILDAGDATSETRSRRRGGSEEECARHGQTIERRLRPRPPEHCCSVVTVNTSNTCSAPNVNSSTPAAAAGGANSVSFVLASPVPLVPLEPRAVRMPLRP